MDSDTQSSAVPAGYGAALTPPPPQRVSPSLALASSEIPSACTARVVVEAIIRLHPDYGKNRAPDALSAVQWPADAVVRRQPVADWYEDARSQFELGDNDLNGPAAIIGIALAERATGRELVRAGLFALMVEDLRTHSVRKYLNPGLEILNPRGRERLGTIPLAALVRDTEPFVVAAGPGRRAKLSPDGRRVVCYRDNEISLWQVDGSRRLRVARLERSQRVLMARITADGAWLVALLSNGSMVRWPADSLTGIESLGAWQGDSPVWGGDLAKDAGCAAVRLSDGLCVLSAGDRVSIPTGERLTGVALSPDGRLIAASSATAIEVFEWTGTRIASLVRVPLESRLTSFDCGPAQVIAATTDGIRVIYGGGGDLLSGLPLNSLERVALSADGMLLAAGGEDITYLIQPASGVVLAELPGGRREERLSFSLDCRRLIASDQDGVARVWDVGVEPPGRPPPAAYSSDTIGSGVDLLGRNRDVDAFASLIAAAAVQPPLSIGVFGDWGSGKSWFMRQIKHRVAEIAADARSSGAPQRELSFYKNIAQVEFNAWHYAESDVLTGLVEHIFTRLDIGDKAGIVQQAKDSALRALADAEEKAGKKADHIRHSEHELAAIEARQLEHMKIRDARAAQLLRDASREQERGAIVLGAKNALRAVGWASAADDITDLMRDLDQASDELRRANPILTPLGDKRGLKLRKRAWLFVLAAPVLAVVAGIALWLAAGRSVGLTALGGLGVLVTSLIAAIGNVVRQSTDLVRENLNELASERLKIEEKITAELAGIDEKISKDRAEAARVHHELDELQLEHRGLVDEVAEREKALAAVRPERLLQDLVKARVSSGDYSRYLGVIAQARHDFEKVSELIRAVNDSLAGTAGPDSATEINRIVLYIDDLDRCEPAKVATVLQAVHLLLAFPLFVVVVGVDSRWVERALRKQYPDLLAGEDVEPRDYLEKIFQIPYWLDRMDSAKTITMLRGIAGAPSAERTGGASRSVPAANGSARPEPGATDGGPAEPPARPSAEPGLQAQVKRSRELNPLGLTIEAHELEAMERLSVLLGRSPRSLKRFVNVYRLIKVRAPDALDFSDPDRADADYLIVLLLLAEMIGRPHEARALFDWIRQTASTEIDPPAGWPRSVQVYRRWIDDVSRFSFEGMPPAAS